MLLGHHHLLARGLRADGRRCVLLKLTVAHLEKDSLALLNWSILLLHIILGALGQLRDNHQVLLVLRPRAQLHRLGLLHLGHVRHGSGRRTAPQRLALEV